MEGYQDIISKLGHFTKKYYTKQLIKGSLLFLALGLLFWLGVVSLEYFLWLDQSWRLTLFLIFICVEGYLLYRFIAIPLLFLFRVKSGLDYKGASVLIGKHFPEVQDKLLNLLELSENSSKSELLIASIDQRAKNLGAVPFADAIDYREGLGYAKYLFIPVLLVGFIWVSGSVADFFNSYKRVVNYELAYEKPAPFTFQLLNDDLKVMDNQPLTVRAITVGDVRPDNVFINIEGDKLLLKEVDGVYSYTFKAPVKSTTFRFISNGWQSREYQLVSYNTPSLVNFEMKLEYPKYLKKTSETISGTGNGVVPEGTKVTWFIEGLHTDAIRMHSVDSTYNLERDKGFYKLERKVFNTLNYELSTSNEFVKDFEKLSYTLDVVKDLKATIQVEQILDSLNPNQSFFTGQTADDYGIDQIRVVCYPVDDLNDVQRVLLEEPNNNVFQFYYTFPSGLQLVDGKQYKLFFEVVDNDALRNGKVTKSQTFNTVLFNDKQLNNKEIEFQKNTISKLEQSLKEVKEQKEVLSQINKSQKEATSISFDDKNEIKSFLQKQEQQEQFMKKFSSELNQSLNKSEGDSELKKMLQERLERQEIEAKKNEELLKELNKVAEQIDKEELQKKLEELSKNQGKNTRNLEQLLELTKRYYVTEKASQIAKELNDLGERQEKLSELIIEKDFTDKEQSELNEEFNELEIDIRELEKDNKGLQKPLDLDLDKRKSDDIKKDQKDALDEINKQQGMEEQSGSKEKEEAGNNASKKQKSAAQKMKEMGEALQQGSAGGGSSSDAEDAEMLRQVLDNLVVFSFKQEALFDNLQTSDVDISQFSRTVKDQQNLKRLFEHVDDSLFALSLRRAELSEFVNEQINEVYYNIDKSLESISDNQIYQGASYQQYVINSTNALADFLANVLDNMQQNMKMGNGSGEGSDFQLPDIIQGQQSIQEKMGNSGQEGKPSKGDGEGSSGNDGNGNQEGEGKGNKKGKGDKELDSKSGQGSGGNGLEEMNLNEVYEIYKEQQFLREQLENQLQNMIDDSDQDLTKKLLQQMEDFENDLLENGITERTKNRANTIQHQLMKLENASLEQGQKRERESNTNNQTFVNPITTRPEALKDYKNNIEILNRQALPLRQNFEKKVKAYFNND